MNLAMLSAELHTSALACFDAFHKELGRRVHVPPSKHVEMLKLVGELFQTQKKSLWLLVAGLKVRAGQRSSSRAAYPNAPVSATRLCVRAGAPSTQQPRTRGHVHTVVRVALC